jgi:hypothetical protein
MSDKLRNTLQNIPEFALGEQPDPFKLNQSFRVVQQALNQLEETIGDVTVKSSDNTNLSDRPLTIGSLGRHMGPVQSISPPMSVNEQFTYSCTLATGTNVWTLPVWAWDGTTIGVTINTNNATDFNGSSLFQTQKTFAQDLTVPGDWKYDYERNTIISFAPMAGGAATAVGTSFPNVDREYGGLGEYWHVGNATPNVQPPFDIATPTSIVVSAGTGAYTHIVTMDPEDFVWTGPIQGTDASRADETNLKARADLAETLEHGINPIYSVTSQVTQRLPYELDPLLSLNDEIPRPFVLLYNETLDNLYETARYHYRDSTSFFFTGPTLNVGHNYRVITAGGADITSTIEGMQFTLQHHKHNGPQAISHWDLVRTGYSPVRLDLPAFIQADSSYGWHRPTFTPKVKGNPHPQYLMRNGFQHGMDDPNMNGVMLGELAMGMKVSNMAYNAMADIWDVDDEESFPHVFGGRAQVRLGLINNGISGGDQALFLSGQGGTNILNHAKNLALITNEDYTLSYWDYGATDSIFSAAAADWQFGRFDLFSGFSPDALRSRLSIQGTANRIGASLTNSRADISGMANSVDGGTIFNSRMVANGSDVTLSMIGGSNVDLFAEGHNVTASVRSSTNSRVTVVGSNINATCTNFHGVDAEFVAASAFPIAPVNNFGSGLHTVAPGTKYFRVDNFMVDADNRKVRRPILKANVMYIDDPDDGFGLRDMQRGDLSWDDSHLGTGARTWLVKKPAAFSNGANLVFDFDLPDDAALSRIRLVTFQATDGPTTYNIIGFGEDGQQDAIRATTTVAAPPDLVTESVLDWNLDTSFPGLVVDGDRFPSGSYTADFQLTLEGYQTGGPPAIVSGWYEYRIMRQ